MLFAHRGCCRKECAENSLESCIESLRKGFSIEVDVRISEDGEAVCIHDASLFRTHGSRRSVRHTKASELERLGVPRLATVLDAVARHPRARIMLDIKVRPSSGPLFVAEALCRKRAISLSRVSAIVWPSPSNFFPPNPPDILLLGGGGGGGEATSSRITLHLGLETVPVPKRLSSRVKAVALPATGQRDIEGIAALQRASPSLKINVYCEAAVFNKAFPLLGPKATFTVSF